MLDYRNSGLTINTLVAVHSEYAIPDVLRALAAFKPQDLATVARAHLKESDVIVEALRQICWATFRLPKRTLAHSRQRGRRQRTTS